MAECIHDTLVVSGAGITGANNTYTKTTAEDDNGYSRWTVDGFTIQHGDVGNEYWFILEGAIPRYRVASLDDCPVDLTWELMPFGGPTPPAPTVTAGAPAPSQPTFGLPVETVALITSRFGTVARFLRLRNQGQV